MTFSAEIKQLLVEKVLLSEVEVMKVMKGGLLPVVVEPLPALAVGEEAVARGALGRALERGLCSGDLDPHGGGGQESRS